MKILKVEVGKEPYVKEIESDLKSLQNEVEGLIEPIYMDDGNLIIVNEEGKINGMEPNRWLGDTDIICGPFFVCGDDGEEFVSLKEEDIEKYREMFSEIPQFTMQEKQLEPRVEIYGFNPKDTGQHPTTLDHNLCGLFSRHNH
ncbi:DUF3846 domain-containing protein [Chakrabartyella piscis]|uniref:DUF3846 domain-containing protein n=1 Tax=Chakrabartyella piscis TaxID=2918914 RepID=UPI002958C7D9|nr:DUF3846 domain-containing protein [Chakrabartyella piscis]